MAKKKKSAKKAAKKATKKATKKTAKKPARKVAKKPAKKTATKKTMRAKPAKKTARRSAPPAPVRREPARPMTPPPPPMAPPLPPPIVATPPPSTPWYGGAGEADDHDTAGGSDADDDELRRSGPADGGAPRGAPRSAAHGRSRALRAPGTPRAKSADGARGRVGAAIDAEWIDELGRPQWLAQCRGRNVVLTFLSFADAGSGAALAMQLRDDLGAFDDAGAVVFVLSCDSPADQRRIAAKYGLTMPLISDPQCEAATLAGLSPTGSAGGAVSVVLDRAGVPCATVRVRDTRQHVAALLREIRCA